MDADLKPSPPWPAPPHVRTVRRDGTAGLPADVAAATEPVILRDFVAHWPVVAAAKRAPDALLEYLMGFENGAVVPVSAGSAALNGRLFYNESFTGLNAERGSARMGEILKRVRRFGAEEPTPLIYLASTDVDACLPGFRAENDVAFDGVDPIASVWIGTKTRIAAHNDLPLNLACVAAGRRRFTLFPPDQTKNLYVGPFEVTPAGRPISLVDFAEPDLERFPRFADAMANAQVAELEAGDALFVPSMWWHHVEALSGFNILLNYWWRTVPAYLGTPQDVLNHAMLTLRDMPAQERKIWRDLFDHYVFDADPEDLAHIPEHARGILSPIDAQSARRVRAFLLNRLNR